MDRWQASLYPSSPAYSAYLNGGAREQHLLAQWRRSNRDVYSCVRRELRQMAMHRPHVHIKSKSPVFNATEEKLVQQMCNKWPGFNGGQTKS